MIESRVKSELARGSALSIIALVEGLLEEAHTKQASDIHIDPAETEVTVRMRIDGVLHDAHVLPKNIQPEIISRIKVLSGLRTDEHQTPQDGRFRIMLRGVTPLDIRVSIAPIYFGENAVLRLLSERSEKLALEMLGLSVEDQEKIIDAIHKPYGMILSTGPTGSGKTTTLYTILKQLHTRDVSIVTIEDPIEYALDGINQMQVNARTGLTFANGLRSILRQDPDIIMVGEIRDTETAGLAINTALTGHLVLSTLHTNDAATTLPRMIDLGIEPYLITATVNIVIGQRLVRKICNACKVKHTLTSVEEKNIAKMVGASTFDKTKTLWHGAGCDSCTGSGYRGRIGIYEVLLIDDKIRHAMLKKSSASDIKKIAITGGMKTMVHDGFEKATESITTLEEVLRVIHE